MYRVFLESIAVYGSRRYLERMHDVWYWTLIKKDALFFNTFEEALKAGLEGRRGYWVGIVIEDESGKEYNIFGANAQKYFDSKSFIEGRFFKLLSECQSLTENHIEMIIAKEPNMVYEFPHNIIVKYLYKKWLEK